MSTETELKLSVTGVTAAQLSDQPVVRKHDSGKHRERHLGNIYFDTPDLRLKDKKIGLRLRLDDGRWLQTVKTKGSASGGLHRRGEWEMPVAGEALELARFDAPELDGLFDDPAITEALKPVFRTDFQRVTWDLKFADGAAIELALDLGEVKAGDQREAISEIELELMAGEADRLFEVARALAETLPVRVLNSSKAERGYRLGGQAGAPRASKAGAVGLAPKCNAEQAFVHIMHHGLTQLQANEPVLLENPGNPEAVHQMRVATRRMRSCLKLFRPLIPRAAGDRLAAEIKWVTDALGPARDWDVFIDETLVPLSGECARVEGLGDLESAARARRDAVYEQAIAAIGSPRFTHLLLDLSLWLEQCPWRDVANKKALRSLDRSARRYGRKVLSKRHRQVIKRGRRFGQMSAAERHQLRIRCKGLRYAAEFFAALYGDDDQSVRYARAVAGLQDALGVLNDGHVVHGLLEQVEAGGMPPGSNVVYGWTAANMRCHLGRFDAAWEAFEAERPFWD